MGKISNFRQLEVWQEAHKLALRVYEVILAPYSLPLTSYSLPTRGTYDTTK
jgi:hypothetical protein